MVRKLTKPRSKVIVMLGAGVSTSAGLPDFRSTNGQGLYSGAQTVSSTSTTQARTTPLRPRPKIGPATFSSQVYNSHADRTLHWQLVSDLHTQVDGIQRSHSSTRAADVTNRGVTRLHSLLGTLKRKNKLKRCYTQNVDGFELVATDLVNVDLPGLTLSQSVEESRAHMEAGSSKAVKGKYRARKWQGDVVQLHGSLTRVRCTACAWVGRWDDAINDKFAQGETIDCPDCCERAETRARQSKRVVAPISFVRPSIVLYNEANPAAQTIGQIAHADANASIDILLVSGTSLKIPGFKQLVKQFAHTVRQRNGLVVFVNKEEMNQSEWLRVFDYQIIGDVETFAERFITKWKQIKPRDWQTQPTLQQTVALQVVKAPPMAVPIKTPILREPRSLHHAERRLSKPTLAFKHAAASPTRPPLRELPQSPNARLPAVAQLPPLPPLPRFASFSHGKPFMICRSQIEMPPDVKNALRRTSSLPDSLQDSKPKSSVVKAHERINEAMKRASGNEETLCPLQEESKCRYSLEVPWSPNKRARFDDR
ncbi:NAD-dependent deacetylase hst3 [Microbotryomycetes sp. JL221]|nr:NAD-dependent deacetylase hst3 [Microbotryomycetes sp. JL221]